MIAFPHRRAGPIRYEKTGPVPLLPRGRREGEAGKRAAYAPQDAFLSLSLSLSLCNRESAGGWLRLGLDTLFGFFMIIAAIARRRKIRG